MEGKVAERNREGVIIFVPEIFSMNEAGPFKNELNDLVAKGVEHFTLDFSKCEFIDSTGLGVIVSIHKRCEQMRGTLQLIAVKRNVMKIFELTMLHRIFNIS